MVTDWDKRKAKARRDSFGINREGDLREMKELQMLKKLTGKVKLVLGTFALVFALALCVEGFSIVSNAETQAKVTASSAKVRKEASTSSDTVGSAARDTVVTVVGETQGADGYVWYQVVVDGNVNGYIRSDLLSLTEAEVSVEKLNPVSGTVKGSTSVRVRQSASTNSAIVKNVASGTALTVTGRATGSDNKVWYQVSFIADGAEVNGFIRNDYVEVSGELTPYTETPVTPPTDEPVTPPTDEPGTENPDTPVVEEPQPTKKYETVLRDDIWYVMDTDTNEGWDIVKLQETANNNANAYAESAKKVKSQKVVIIILVFLLIAAAGGIAFLIYKIKDMMDSAYFNEVEAETLRRRNAQAAQGQKRVMHTVGEEKKAGAPQGARPQGARPAGAPAGNRPAGAPAGNRSAGAPAGNRPAGAPGGNRPQGARPAGAPVGNRPAGAPQGARPTGAPAGNRPTGAPQASQEQAAKNPDQGQAWQSKNFMADDEDEFEFEFLSYDNDDEK